MAVSMSSHPRSPAVSGHPRSLAGDATTAFVTWLVTGAVGPALVALPVNWAADKLAGAARRWFKRLRQTDDLSRLVKAAADSSVQLSREEISNLRALLEKEQTWKLLAGGRLDEKLQELIRQIKDLMPPRDGRTAEDAHVVAKAIARGLLEFAVFHLEPEIFQKVVTARLQQMTDQASALDGALFRMHKDLYHRIDDVQDLFRQVMDQLPAVSADLNEIRIYLNTLIGWLNTDPWPQDLQLGGPTLTPAAIERKLRINAPGPAFGQEADADELTRQCSRLVVLGGPGSGKTWLAMRTARICAEEALKALEDMSLDEVELPLYTTCARLIRAHGGIRQAAVSSAIEWIADLGGARIVQALCRFFTERDMRTLLVIDSLDEASDPGLARDRLRQASSLKQPWRVVLTSRPSSWNNQLTVDAAKQDQKVGELQPLRYPSDVEPVIRRWFEGDPERGRALAAQIAARPSLQQAATVPLILAFYCILGGQQPLPEFRHKLYGQVINRMLRGPWRSSSSPPPDIEDCRQRLRAWAWQGAKNNKVSGIGEWEDDIPTRPAQLSPAGQVAVDHVAASRGGPDFDTGETLRRFVHRSIREHLVAEYVARLPADQAVQELLPHLWYDLDWEYTAPGAIALHPDRDEILQELMRITSQPGEIPGYLFVADSGGAGRRFLSRVAAESREGDWSAELATVIGEARVELARLGIVGDLGGTAHWPTSNCRVREALLRHLIRCRESEEIYQLAGTLAQLDPTPEEKRLARHALVGTLANRTASGTAKDLVAELAQLGATPEDRHRARQALLKQLTARRTGSEEAAELVGTLLQLDPTAEDKHRAWQVLLRMLPRTQDQREAEALAGALAQLDATPEDNHRARQVLLNRLASRRDFGKTIEDLAALTHLRPTAEDKHQARQALLSSLARNTSTTSTWAAVRVSGALARLHTTAEEKRLARQELQNWLAAHEASGEKAAVIAGMLVQLDPTAEDKDQARQVLLECLVRQIRSQFVNSWAARLTLSRMAAQLTGILVQLDPTEEDKHQARRVLLWLLARGTGHWMATQLISILVQLDPTEEDKHQARQAMPQLLAGKTLDWTGRRLIVLFAQLDPTENDKGKASQALLNRLAAHETSSEEAARIAGTLVQLDPTAEDKHQARQALLNRLAAHETSSEKVAELAQVLALLNPTAAGKDQARRVLLERLDRETDGRVGDSLTAALARLDPTEEDKHQALPTLLRMLAYRPWLVHTLAQLDLTPDDKHRARQVLLECLARKTGRQLGDSLKDALAQLDPTVHDLSSWGAWVARPTPELLAAVRRNSPVDQWLAALPSLSSLSP